MLLYIKHNAMNFTFVIPQNPNNFFPLEFFFY